MKITYINSLFNLQDIETVLNSMISPADLSRFENHELGLPHLLDETGKSHAVNRLFKIDTRMEGAECRIVFLVHANSRPINMRWVFSFSDEWDYAST